jgi:hypothetical protein
MNRRPAPDNNPRRYLLAADDCFASKATLYEGSDPPRSDAVGSGVAVAGPTNGREVGISVEETVGT